MAFILRSDFARGLRLPERAHEVMPAGEKDWGKKREDASHVELHETYYEPHSRINHSVARSGQHRVHMDQAFLPGDVWRGHLTSCHQTALHARRRFRYVAVERGRRAPRARAERRGRDSLRRPRRLSIDRADPHTGELVMTFVSHFDHSRGSGARDPFPKPRTRVSRSRLTRFYELKGTYDAELRHLQMTPVRGKIGAAWEPCDAEAYVSHDFSTISGLSLCESHGACDPGGGEFLLRHDRTQFVVEGAGDPRVDGEYSSQPRFPVDEADPSHVTLSRNTQLYDGAPVYLQACPRGLSTCEDRFAIVHEVIGQYGFWRIVPASVLTKPSAAGAAGADHAVYSVCSEDVYPPDNGWRPLRGPSDGPPPMVRATVRSMYTDLQNHATLRAGAPNRDPQAAATSVLLLATIGGLLWVLVVLALRAPVRLKKQPTRPAHHHPGSP